MCKQTRVPAAEQKVFNEIHPKCVTNFYGKEPYAGAGWRYVDNGKTYTEIYKKVPYRMWPAQRRAFSMSWVTMTMAMPSVLFR